jgi:glycine dehydrogenase subunit 1
VATIYCSLVGKKGIREIASQNVAKTQYALRQLEEIPSVTLPFSGSCFNEVVIQLKTPFEEAASRFRSAKVVPGLLIEKDYPDLKNALLLSFTETKSKAEIDYLMRLLADCQG